MARRKLTKLIATVLVAFVGTLASHAVADDRADGHVIVTIDDLRNARGVVRCVLFDRSDGWPEIHTKALRVITVSIDGKRATCDFANLAPGGYAFAYMHDENDNKKLDKNIIGVPIEGYGVSNDVRGTVSAPSFASARFKFDGGTLRVHPKTTY